MSDDVYVDGDKLRALVCGVLEVNKCVYCSFVNFGYALSFFYLLKGVCVYDIVINIAFRCTFYLKVIDFFFDYI